MKRFLLVAALLLAACGDDPPERGDVIDRRHRPQHTHWHDGGTTCVSYDSKTGACTISIPNADRPHEHCVGGCWELKLRDCDDSGDCQEGWVGVTEDTYERFPIGTNYPDEPELR